MTQDDHADQQGAAADPLRDFLLGLATQIDQVAGLIGGGQRAWTSTDAAGTRRAGAAPDVGGEITSLLAEIGDLLARLISALIAVLEAIAKALRSAPATAEGSDNRYEPIAVRIDVTNPAARVPTPEGDR
jgi:hypothetical protein